MSKTAIEMRPNPTFYISWELGSNEIQEVISWMSDHTGEAAPTAYKELLTELRKAIERR